MNINLHDIRDVRLAIVMAAIRGRYLSFAACEEAANYVMNDGPYNSTAPESLNELIAVSAEVDTETRKVLAELEKANDELDDIKRYCGASANGNALLSVKALAESIRAASIKRLETIEQRDAKIAELQAELAQRKAAK